MKQLIILALAAILTAAKCDSPTTPTNPCPEGYRCICEKIAPPDTITVPPVPSTGFKVGSNSFPWFPQSRFADIGMKWQRVYCSSGWIWRPDGIAVQPMWRAETEENHGIDEMLAKAKAFGINTLLTIHQTPEFYRPTGRDDGANDYPPIKAGANRKDPASYRDYAAFLFQVSARYGRVKHPDASLMVDVTPRWSGDILNVKKSGLDLLTYLEPWNESSKWWKIGTPEAEAYFQPEETAALMSACYDGHEGSLGAGVGIRTADPSMVVVMPALTDFEFDYIAKMTAWFTANRKDKSWPCQIMNFHHYSNIGNNLRQHPAQWQNDGACLPADDKNFQSVSTLVGMADGMGKQIWITEFGADKRSPSQMTAKGIGKSNELFQAEIIIASIEAYKKAGVDAVFVFTGPDENSGADGGQFESCGIFTSQADGYKPTPASVALKAYLEANAPKQNRAVAKQQILPKMSDGKRPMK